MRAGRRHSALIAILASLFVLQAPLCALACLDLGETDVPALEKSAGEQATQPLSGPLSGQEALPCHERTQGSSQEGEPGSMPAHAPAPDRDCGCESQSISEALFLPSSPPAPSPAPLDRISFGIPAPQSEPIAARLRSECRITRQTDLPPPDILLRNSTLLL